MSKPYASRDLQLINLKNITKIFDNFKVEYFICFGTLLGYTRNQNIIIKDDDIDFLVNKDSYDKLFNFFKTNQFNISISVSNVFMQLRIVHNGVNTLVDLYFYEKTNEFIIEKWNFLGRYTDINNHIHIPLDYVYPIQKCSMQNILVSVPNKCHDMCGYLYGPRYMESLSKQNEYSVRIINHKPSVAYSFKPQLSAPVKSVWDNIYKDNKIVYDGSSFAQFTLSHIKNSDSLIDIGCGNGRDSNYFFENNIKNIIAIDYSEEVIKQNIEKYEKTSITFMPLSVVDLGNLNKKFDNIYSRFFIHAINAQMATKMLQDCYDMLNDTGLLFIECRSVNDPICGKGVKGLEKNEYVYGHYRRFIEKDELLDELQKIGYKILYSLEDNNLSVYNNDNPALIRIICEK